jgi:hypothetical protein
MWDIKFPNVNKTLLCLTLTIRKLHLKMINSSVTLTVAIKKSQSQNCNRDYQINQLDDD